MCSPAFHCWLCAFLASAASVVSAPPYNVLTEADILREWIDWGDTWGMDECFPDSLPSSVCEILSCTDDGFSLFYPDVHYQDISGQASYRGGFTWLAGYPMVTDNGSEILSFPTLMDFMYYYNSPGIGVLPTYNFNLLSWSSTTNPPFITYESSSVSGMFSRVNFRWEGCPVLTDYYIGVNYVPRWWADGNIIGVIPSSVYHRLSSCFSRPRERLPVPCIYVRDTDLRNVFTNSIHFKFGELWE